MPKSHHLFLTVNTNIISRGNIDQKLLLAQQLTLKSGEEFIENFDNVPIIPEPECIPQIKLTLEKIFW